MPNVHSLAIFVQNDTHLNKCPKMFYEYEYFRFRRPPIQCDVLVRKTIQLIIAQKKGKEPKCREMKNKIWQKQKHGKFFCSSFSVTYEWFEFHRPNHVCQSLGRHFGVVVDVNEKNDGKCFFASSFLILLVPSVHLSFILCVILMVQHRLYFSHCMPSRSN